MKKKGFWFSIYIFLFHNFYVRVFWDWWNVVRKLIWLLTLLSWLYFDGDFSVTWIIQHQHCWMYCILKCFHNFFKGTPVFGLILPTFFHDLFNNVWKIFVNLKCESLWYFCQYLNCKRKKCIFLYLISWRLKKKIIFENQIEKFSYWSDNSVS